MDLFIFFLILVQPEQPLHSAFIFKSILNTWTCSFHAEHIHIVKVKLDSGVGTQLRASINTADNISLLLSMTDFEFMTPH